MPNSRAPSCGVNEVEGRRTSCLSVFTTMKPGSTLVTVPTSPPAVSLTVMPTAIAAPAAGAWAAAGKARPRLSEARMIVFNLRILLLVRAGCDKVRPEPTPRLFGQQDFLNLRNGMAGEILGDLARQPLLDLLVIMFAKL